MQGQFYYDIVCPYAYMAFDFLRRARVFEDKRLELKPVLLGGLFKLMEQEADPNQFFSKDKKNYLKHDIERQARYFGAKLKFHSSHPLRSLTAMRLLVACGEDEREQLSARLYQAYWQESLDIDQDEVVLKIAADGGVKDAAQKIKLGKDLLIEATNEAFKQKIFGVPSILLNDRLYFGGDRLALIEKELGIKLPDSSWAKGSSLEFYFDFSSPYSYLAWTELKQAQDLGVKIDFRPALLGAIFKAQNTVNIPMLAAHPNKTLYYMQDMNYWAQSRRQEFNFNAHFPLRTVAALRVSLIDSKTIPTIFEAAWQKNLNIGDEQVLEQVLLDAGFDAKKLLADAKTEQIKDKLRTNTDRAIARGVFGMPSIFVGEELFFGQDRFALIRQRLTKLCRPAA